jgi:hypothetical protein
MIYYFVVSAVNSAGESANSAEVSARSVSSVPPQLNFLLNGNILQFDWLADHLIWQLQMQTNSLNASLGTNWTTVSGSTATNQIWIPINAANSSIFFRLVYP